MSINGASLERVPDINERKLAAKVFKSPCPSSYVSGLKWRELRVEAKPLRCSRYGEKRRSAVRSRRRCLLAQSSSDCDEKQPDRAHTGNPPLNRITPNVEAVLKS